jgi:predicted tellurium resistance membrane protein TerC
VLEVFSTPEAWISLATLTALEIVLGIDNVIFITILVGKLPPAQQGSARKIGLGLALGSRLALLFALSWIMRLTEPWFTVMGRGLSGRDLILLVGGLFLVGKSTHEIYDKLEVEHDPSQPPKGGSAYAWVLVQIMLLDVVFSLDSVITAVGMAKHIPIMVAAMVIAVGVMLVFAKPIGDFVTRHPSMKILALSFLLLIGVLLVAEGFGQHVSKGYVYFAMAFSLAVELVNIRMRRAQQKALHLHGRFEKEGA